MNDKDLIILGIFLILLGALMLIGLKKEIAMEKDFIVGRVIESEKKNNNLIIDIEVTEKKRVIIYDYEGPFPEKDQKVMIKTPQKEKTIIGEKLIVIN